MKLDIIIPCYNAKDTLFRTLSSIAFQRGFQSFSVWLVNDCSSYDYSYFVDYFSKYFPVREISLKENVGPGGARNVGIKNTSSPYILFMDSDDYFYTYNALSLLINPLNHHPYDLIVSDFLYERDGEKIIKHRNSIWLHGKVFKRDFLDKNHISFNHTRANEDNGFNRLVIFMKPNTYFLDEITYVYSENAHSITRRNNRSFRFEGLEGYTYNMQWAMEEALKRNCDSKEIATFAMDVLVRMFFYYMELYQQYDVSKLIQWSRGIYKLYCRFPEHSVSSSTIQGMHNHYQMEYLNQQIHLTECFSFEEFLQKVSENHG